MFTSSPVGRVFVPPALAHTICTRYLFLQAKLQHWPTELYLETGSKSLQILFWSRISIRIQHSSLYKNASIHPRQTTRERRTKPLSLMEKTLSIRAHDHFLMSHHRNIKKAKIERHRASYGVIFRGIMVDLKFPPIQAFRSAELAFIRRLLLVRSAIVVAFRWKY